MNSFTNFYLLEEEQVLSIDLRKQMSSLSEITNRQYNEIKEYLFSKAESKEAISINGKSFVITKISASDQEHSKLSGILLLKHEMEKTNEIIRIETNKGTLHLFITEGKGQFCYIISDKDFSHYMGGHVKDIVNSLMDLIENQKGEQTAKANAEREKEEANKSKEDVEKNQAKALKRKEATQKGIETRKKTLAQRKADEEAKRKEDEKIKNLGSSDPRNGKFGYFDLDYADVELLRERFMQNSNWIGKKREYAWKTDTRNSSFQEFGEGFRYEIAESFKGKTGGDKGEVILFQYFKNILPNIAMIIFKGELSFNIFCELQILKPEDKIGLEKKIHLRFAPQVRWFNNDPKQLAPVDRAETLDKKQNENIGWYDRNLVEV